MRLFWLFWVDPFFTKKTFAWKRCLICRVTAAVCFLYKVVPSLDQFKKVQHHVLILLLFLHEFNCILEILSEWAESVRPQWCWDICKPQTSNEILMHDRLLQGLRSYPLCCWGSALLCSQPVFYANGAISIYSSTEIIRRQKSALNPIRLSDLVVQWVARKPPERVTGLVSTFCKYLSIIVVVVHIISYHEK